MAAANTPPGVPGVHLLDVRFQQALKLHEQGDLPAAAALYESVLASDPVHFDALHLLGVIAAQSGNPARAVALIDQALAVDAKQVPAHFHRALALRDQGKAAEALAGFEAVLALNDRHADARTAHAEILRDLNRPEQALRSFSRAIELDPQSVQNRYARGVLLQDMQRQEQALADYDAVLAAQPGFAGAINNRALALHALRRYEEALDAFAQLAQLVPDHAPAHLGRGRALAALGRHAAALSAFESALALDPALPGLRLEVGRSLRESGRMKEALAAFDAFLEQHPEDAVAWHELALTRMQAGRAADALPALDRALQISPGFAEARANRAIARQDAGNGDAALEDIEQAAAQRPEMAQIWLNRGLILAAHHRYAEACASQERAIALEPTSAAACANRGHCLEKLWRLPEALASYERACALAPRDPDYQFGRGAILHLLQRHEEALACYNQALEARPDQAVWLSNRAAVLRQFKRFADALADYRRLVEIAPGNDYAQGNLLHVELLLCDWRQYGGREQLLAGMQSGTLADMPFQSLSTTSSAALQLQCARRYARLTYPRATPPWQGPPYRHQRIRLAYLTADLGFHPVSHLMARLFEIHDRERFEVYVFSLKPLGDGPFERRLRAAFDHFIDASWMSDEQVALEMRTREIDIAIDLMGYTSVARTGVFLHRPAPVHAAYLGYAGTLAAGCMDYLIADEVVIPPTAERFYEEQVVRLPASFMPRDPTLPSPPAPGRAQAGLPEHGFVFCCFNNSYKINPAVFDVWMRLLKALPDSVLWLSFPGKEAHENLTREAGTRGISPQRIVFAEKVPAIEDHLARASLADLFLDTLPYNAHTTASDSLWAGVPVVTCAGESFASRVAASLLTSAGLSELITHDLAQYEALALRLAKTPALLAELRARLVRGRAKETLFPVDRLRASIETAYLRMHERSGKGLPPQAFSV